MGAARPTRRRFLAFLGAAPILAACGGDTPPARPAATSAASTPPPSSAAAPISSAPSPSLPPASRTPGPIAAPGTPVAAASASAAPASGSPARPTARPPAVTPSGTAVGAARPPTFAMQEYPILGSAPHDVAPAADGGVWYVAQASGELGLLDPASGRVREMIPLGRGSAPHGVIVGPDGAPWITDGGQNAIVRVDPAGGGPGRVQVFPLPGGTPPANLNTAVFDRQGRLWFTGQNGYYGRLGPNGMIRVFEAPRGRGPYGITATPEGVVYYASLAGNHIARIEGTSGTATVIAPPTPDQGARRVWSDSRGRIWVSEWNAGQVSRYDPAANTWRVWPLPGRNPQAYAVYVDERDIVWLTEFTNNAIVRFDPATETFQPFPLPTPAANVRQLLGRPGEVWGAESSADKLVVIRTT